MIEIGLDDGRMEGTLLGRKVIEEVEERDRACGGRTLRRSQCRSGHSPSNAADGDQTAGLVAVEESRLDRSFHHESWIRVLVAMCSQSTLILAHSLIRYP